jgi:acetoacetyl-CoA synthetase
VPANLQRFLAGFGDYESLHRWSLEQPEEFWPAVWRFCGVKSTRGWTRVLDPETGQWFPGAELNFAATILRPSDNEPALLSLRRTLTHQQLAHETARIAKALQAGGIQTGDAVAACLPVLPETIAALLATASIGAYWLPFSLEDPGPLATFQPKLLLAAPDPRLPALAAGLPTLRQALIVTTDDPHPSLGGLPRALRLQDATAFFQGCLDPEPRSLPFRHPLLLAGGPVAYPAGGLLLQFLKELVLHFDLRPHTRIPLAGAGPISLLRAATALGAGATLDLEAPHELPEVILPASPTLPNPLLRTPARALGIHAANGHIQPPCPSLPIDWPA